MPNADDMRWFKDNFHAEVEAAIAGTPFSVDLVVAVACQETGHIWSSLRKKGHPIPKIMTLCVGDTIDFRPSTGTGRKAFPRTKAALLEKPKGEPMFRIARQALIDMAEHVPGFQSAVNDPNKFCHGFGMFQYDLQFFLTDPDYFLEKRYERFSETLGKAVTELRAAAKRIGLHKEATLDERQQTAVAIAYNTGGFNPKKGLKQGHFNGQRYYGEEILDFIRLSRTVPVPGDAAPAVTEPATGAAIVPAPTPVTATGPFFEVDTKVTTLRVRSEPTLSKPPGANVIAQLPDGHPVRSITGTPVKGFLEIETSLHGAHIRGFASATYLKPAPAVDEIPVAVPQAEPPTSGIVAVYMPRKAGTITKRTAIAGAHSLNEPDQPSRRGATPAELCAELGTIIDYLAVDKASHKRYQPRTGMTFCNIYAHDYCTLAGVYLPRVWWTQGAIERLAQGQSVNPLYGDTIDELRANDLFRWLRAFGLRFGWRQTGTLTKLQQEANQGGIALIVARRKEDGKSGHIVTVVPETEDARAKRDADGEVTHPLQSQAGASNFRRGTGSLDWWKGNQFAESAFWIHA